jgi:hypothetical protein
VLWLHHSAAEPRSRVAILSRHNAGLVVASPFSQSSRKFCGSSWSRPENFGSWSVSAGVVTRNCSMKAVRASTSFLVRVEAQAIRSCSCLERVSTMMICPVSQGSRFFFLSRKNTQEPHVWEPKLSPARL